MQITGLGKRARKTTSSPFGQSWFKRRYLQKDKNGKVIETPEQMFRRVANTIAEVETRYGATNSKLLPISSMS
jgi:ribonucleotide reductase alpha subunit